MISFLVVNCLVQHIMVLPKYDWFHVKACMQNFQSFINLH